MNYILKSLPEENIPDGEHVLSRYFSGLFEKQYERGQCINEVVLNSSMIFIEKGKVSILNNDHHTIRFKEQFVHAGSFANLETAFNSDVYKNYELRIEEPTTIKKISFEVFNDLLTDGSFNKVILHLLANQARNNQRKVNQLRFMNSKYRVLYYLLELANKKGREIGYEVVVDFPPTQLEIAIASGNARQTVTTILIELRKDKLIHYNRRCFIFRDLEKLQNILKEL